MNKFQHKVNVSTILMDEKMYWPSKRLGLIENKR
jgi:hypothetical protein